MFSKYLKLQYLRYLGAAGLVALGCSANTDTSTEDPTQEPEGGPDQGSGEGATASSEQALSAGVTRVGRWRFNESFGQTVIDSNGMNNGYLGSTTGIDDNDPFRSALNNPRENADIGRSLFFRSQGLNAPPKEDFVTVPALDPEEEEQTNIGVLQPQMVSVEAWIRTATPPVTGSLGYIVSKGIDQYGGSCSASSYYLYMDHDGLVRFGVTYGVGQVRESAPSQSLLGLVGGLPVWHHVVGTYNGKRALVYVDGQLQGAAPPVPDLTLSFPVRYDGGKSANLHFGAYNGGTGCELGFYGRVDDVRIYSGALTAADVLQRFNGTITPPIHDDDLDGVPNDLDRCPNTLPGDHPVSSRGCGCMQIEAGVALRCPTSAPMNNPEFCYRNHGAYVSCVDNRLEFYAPEDTNVLDCVEKISDDASHSDIGKPDGDLTCED